MSSRRGTAVLYEKRAREATGCSVADEDLESYDETVLGRRFMSHSGINSAIRKAPFHPFSYQLTNGQSIVTRYLCSRYTKSIVFRCPPSDKEDDSDQIIGCGLRNVVAIELASAPVGRSMNRGWLPE